MSADLSARLKRIKEARRKQPDAAGFRLHPSQQAPVPASEIAPERSPRAILAGWREVSPLVFARETSEPLDADASRPFASALLDRTLGLGELVFMDTETTGLSGGAGTTVFLVGAGRVADGEVRVRQLLLGDFPGEPGFLNEVRRALDSDVWVSYNGKAFDARLLESRFLMNGMPPLAAEQLDLLTWSRRLWRARIGSCSLGDVERVVLGRGRDDDIPGIEIPERYFEFLRTRDGALLEEVFEHHRLDIVSLVHLFLRIERSIRDPLAEPEVDSYRLGRWMLSRDASLGFRLLERATAEGGEDSARAALLLSRLLRRGGRAAEALVVLDRLPQAQDEPFGYAVVVERAKLFEHDLRDPFAARAVVERYLERVGSPRPELLHRLARLTRKTG